MKNNLRLFLCTFAILSFNANSSIVSLVQNAHYPDYYMHGANVSVYESWLDIDATCTGSDSDFTSAGSASATYSGCVSGTADGELNFSTGSTSLLADGTVSVSVQDTSNIADAVAVAIAAMNISFSVDVTSNYEISALFVDSGTTGAAGFASLIQIFEDGSLIEDVSNNPMGTMTLQGTFQSGRTYQLISGIAVFGDTNYYPVSTGNGTGFFSTSLTIVPIPVSIWLFGSGLLGLFGISIHKKAV